MKVLFAIGGIGALVTAGLLGASGMEARRVDGVWADLAARAPVDPPLFDAGMVEGLPAPARRYFLYAIQSGTPILTVAEIGMAGDLSRGPASDPVYDPMFAQQILAAPHGFNWKCRFGAGPMRLSGSDGIGPDGSWTRFRLLGLIPVASAGGTADHALSSFGRLIAEAIIWTPAALLPGDGVRWEAVDDRTARVTVDHAALSQTVEIDVAEDGQLQVVRLSRWTDANDQKTFRWQMFGAYPSRYRTFGGYRLPTRVEAGNHFETDAYFPFFRADVRTIKFIEG